MSIVDRFNDMFIGCTEEGCLGSLCSKHQFKKEVQGKLPFLFLAFVHGEIDSAVRQRTQSIHDELHQLFITSVGFEERTDKLHKYISSLQHSGTRTHSQVILSDHWLCKGPGKESNCHKVFFNDDDNVCVYCGSKNTTPFNVSYEI